MTNNTFAVQVAASSLAVLCAGPYAVLAEDVATGTLETYVVSATRVETPKSQVGSAVTKISHEQIETAQIVDFTDVLQLAPGAIIAPGGQRGGISSLFLRGTNSNQTQVVVDGIRINDSNVVPNAFLGGATASHLGSVEVLRGPQSALYGGEAIGGVIALTTPRASGAPFVSWTTTAGSFNTFEHELAAQITDGPAAWSLSFGRESTDNARLHNDFDQFFYSGRFDVDLSDSLSAGFTVRGANRVYENPGSSNLPDPDDYDEDRSSLWTGWLDLDVTDGFNSRLTLGVLDQRLINHFPPFIPSTRTVNFKKDTVDWRNVIDWNERLQTVLGVTEEVSHVADDGFGSVNEKEAVVGVYGEQTVKPIEHLTVTGGTRWEEYDSFGSVWTWRGVGAYELPATDTILRASYGTGFRAPSFLELYGFDPPFLPWYGGFQGNPALRPETSRGWDVGIEQRLLGTTSIAMTWFENQLRDLIEFDFAALPGTANNTERAHTQGLEVELHGDIARRAFWQVAYTYLEAENDGSHTRLVRRPEHTLGFDLHSNWLEERLTLGVGGYAIQNRTDIRSGVFPTTYIDGDDYFLARAYAAYDVSENLSLHLRLENALDERYNEVDGYPGRPQGLFGGVKIRF